ncbi:MAG TPA: TerB family tellurite resistance protein [Stellaceae bacterium]|jgi:DnaJ like chaperone protein|nr:TerB family tellurite resistance protein [Stellaceae bacterium]
MSFIGRIVTSALDLSFGGPLGALLDRAADHIVHRHGHGHDPADADPRRTVAFTIAAIALGAKMARADGDVTRDEVAAFHEVFQVPPGEEEHVRLVFDLARKSSHGFEGYARQVGRLFAADPIVLEHLLDGLFHIALADGRICPAEDAYLREVARHFGFDGADYARIRAHHVGSDDEGAEDAYAILGVLPGAPPDELRVAYHRLVRESHPDLVVAQGLPPECVALATAKVARINAAYDRLARHGGPTAAAG